jgi:hypothetical protein
LEGVLDSVFLAGRLNEPERTGDGTRRIVLEPVGERHEEKHLGVGRAFELRVQRRVDCDHEVAFDALEIPDQPVVHPEPAAVAERVAVRLLDCGARRGADVREDDSRSDMAGELTQVALVPGGLDAVKHGWCVFTAVPADAEAVAVRRLRAELRVEALVDQRVLRFIEQSLEQDRGAGVCEPATQLTSDYRPGDSKAHRPDRVIPTGAREGMLTTWLPRI